jgi:hypothetical protein
MKSDNLHDIILTTKKLHNELRNNIILYIKNNVMLNNIYV